MLAPRPNNELVDVALDRIMSHATEEARADMNALLVCGGEIRSVEDLDLYYLAAVILRSQNRIDSVIDFKIVNPELIWAAVYPYLQAVGYDLASRYAIGCTDRNGVAIHANPSRAQYERTMPSTQSTSGQHVILKIACTNRDYLAGEELDILQYLNDPVLRNHPDNAAVELLDVLDFPSLPHERDQQLASHFRIIVMPVLRELVHGAREETGSLLELMRQAFAAVAFLHSHGICHRDIGPDNFMVSGDPPHWRLHLIDFGNSFRLPNADSSCLQAARGPSVPGQVNARPEYDYGHETLHNPFMAEVYSLGRTWEVILTKRPRAIQRLIDSMQDPIPDARPTAAMALHSLRNAIDKLPPHTLRKQQYLFLKRISPDSLVSSHPGSHHAILDRVLATLLFCLLSFLVYLLGGAWERPLTSAASLQLSPERRW